MPALIHDPPIPRSEIRAENRTWLEATYRNAIAVADQAVGRILDRIKALDVYGKTTVMILGDHGESLFDDGFLGHGHALNEIQTRIPLIINRACLDIRCAIGQMDMATLLAQIATGQFTADLWNDDKKVVLQVVGSLRKPQLIGTVSYGEMRTILDMRTRKNFLNDQKTWLDFDPALADPHYSPRIRTLVSKWETACWEGHNPGK